MKPCISQATTLSTPLDAEFRALAQGGWQAVELWLTKVEAYLESRPIDAVGELLAAEGLTAAAAAGQGGLLLSRGEQRQIHWAHFRRRLELLEELEVPLLVISADSVREFTAADYGRAAADLAEAADLAARSGVRLALEFQKAAGFCASLDTALALIAQCGPGNVGVCLDLFHYYCGPSKFEDLANLTKENLAWVQICDLSGMPRELAGDSDRILPGEGDFQIEPILDVLDRIGYVGHVSLEVLNPLLWQVPAERLADFGFQALCRALGPRLESPVESRGGA